ncbi:DUF4476 domain-containing protein [Hugenholtzia roseola]|uniref:DUF4476 domain-containing protein n=1 Tax=Hugenholtzia roseola TaxID=1002 RepID=UPI0012B5A7ED|nr:DUF4476 domain-containing protein [Hugenholtzia roseola]
MIFSPFRLSFFLKKSNPLTTLRLCAGVAFLSVALTSCGGNTQITMESTGQYEADANMSHKVYINDSLVKNETWEGNSAGAFEHQGKVKIGDPDNPDGSSAGASLQNAFAEVEKALSDQDPNDIEPIPAQEGSETSVGKQNQPLKATLNCQSVITKDEFVNLKEKVRKAFMDEDKVTVAQNSFNSQCLTASQAADLASLLSMDDNKLTLFKFLYGRTQDKQNFEKEANLILKFSRSKNALAAFIKAQ